MTYEERDAAELGLAGKSATVIAIECPTEAGTGSDARWQAPGAFLIVKDRDHLLMVWEGAFFELTRRSDQ